ncbi:hypothetical protein Tco_0585913 [Tanacetum coccineum]
MNILNYTSVSSDYFPASLGSSSFNSSKNSTDNMIPPVFLSFYNNPYLKNVQAFYAKELPISSPDPITPPAILTPSPVLPPSLLFDPRYFFVPEELLPPKKQIHSPSSSSTTISDLEQIIEKTQAYHQTNQEDWNGIFIMKAKNDQSSTGWKRPKRVGRRKWTNRIIRVPAFMCSCRIEEELTWVKTFGKEVKEYVTKVIAKDDLMENEQVYAKTGFAPHRIPQSEGNHNGWLSEEEEADSDSESTASNCPHTVCNGRSMKE